MKPEDKAAIKSGSLTFLVGGLFALCVSNPVLLGAVTYGAYKMGKAARRDALSKQKSGSSDEPHLFI